MGAEPLPAFALRKPPEVARLRAVHQEMVDAALAGGGVDRLAELAAAHVGRPVALVVPDRAAAALGLPAGATVSAEVLAVIERYELERAKADAVAVPAPVESTVDITSGGDVIGGAHMLRAAESAAQDAEEILHLAALTTITIVALEEARELEAARLGSGLVEEVRRREVDRAEIIQRAARLGCDLEWGAVVVACEIGENSRPREATAVITTACPRSISARVDDRIVTIVPAGVGEDAAGAAVEVALALADRLRSYGRTGVSSFYTDPAQIRRAIQEAELVLEVTGSDERVAEQLNGRGGSGVYRLLFRALASHPEEVRNFYEDTVAAVVRYDDQYHTGLLTTLESYLEHDCNMNATARTIYAHRHTVAYRLQRVRELTGLDPMISEQRERLSLGLKAYRIVAPTLPR